MTQHPLRAVVTAKTEKLVTVKTPEGVTQAVAWLIELAPELDVSQVPANLQGQLVTLDAELASAYQVGDAVEFTVYPDPPARPRKPELVLAH